MADINGTPQLKRKRQGAEQQRKKAKMQGKSEVVANGEVEAGTPVKAKGAAPEIKSTPEPKSKQDKQPTPQSAQTNEGPANPASSAPSTSRKKKNRAKSKTDKPLETEGTAALVVSDEEEGDVSQEQKDDAAIAVEATEGSRPKRSQEKKQKKKDKKSVPWSLGAPQGGWFLPQDPVFSPDEKYLLLGKLKALEVYANDTSLLARQLQIGGTGVALAYATSSTNPDLVYVADSSGIITLWDWTNGTKLGRWDIGADVRNLVVVEQPRTSQDLVFAYEAGSSHVINVHALRTGSDASKTELKEILTSSRPITEMQVLLQGKIVVLSTDNSIIFGKRKKFHKTALQDFQYTWREFETSKRITTFNAFVQTPGTDEKKKKQEQRDHLDLAIGDEEGVIYLFEDIISSFAAIERSQKEKNDEKIGPESLRPKRLHWHRTAVGSLKWSLDGNYLISGGDETVLNIWQLSTGKQQHLPHLTAAIESIVVSPSGASYGVSLANNSVIVLSTSELKAKTNIVGIQTRMIDGSQLSKLSDPHHSSRLFDPVPMGVDPKNNNEVIFVTPSSQPRRKLMVISEPYVQTFDIANQRPVARQSLTRNNATDPNMGPDGRPILEPNVNLLQISHDGAWLATVDEWTPPPADLRHIEEGIPAFNEEERTFRREVYLKIWRRDEQNAQWVLDARIDAPHFIEAVSAHARVLDLVADPSGTGFATVGEDRVVRVWRPKTRTRDGMVVRGVDQRGLVTWSLDRATKIADKLDIDESHEGPQETTIRTSRLAFSADGSVLAAGVSWASNADPGVIHVIDSETGTIRRSITEVDVTALAGLAILRRHLVIVGSTIAVWDMVMDQLLYCIPNETPGIKLAVHGQLLHLAVSEEDGTFAVSAPRLHQNDPDGKRSKKVSTRVIIFSPDASKSLWHGSIPEVVLALVSAKGGRGFIALDASSNVRVIGPTVATLQLPTPPPESASAPVAESMDVAEDDEEDSAQAELQFDASDELLQASENDKPVVRPEQLQQIFDSGPSHALPPVRDLFDAVVGLYGRKPRVNVVVAT